MLKRFFKTLEVQPYMLSQFLNNNMHATTEQT